MLKFVVVVFCATASVVVEDHALYGCGFCSGGEKYCNQTTGECTRHCQPGFMGVRCDRPCYQGTYGRNCAERCGNCASGKCDSITGRCENGQCANGYFGIRCSFTSKDTVQCIRCVGNDQHDCDGERCIHACEAGYYGESCEAECPTGFYGQNCTSRCMRCLGGELFCVEGNHPVVEATCSKGCAPGYRGAACTQWCPADKHGENCKGYCGRCAGGSWNCHSEDMDVFCTKGCVPGVRLSNCAWECEAGRWGVGCNESCGECRSGTCSALTGQCVTGACKDGFIGALCKTACLGPDCPVLCGRCLGGSIACDTSVGVCKEGCEAGWTGIDCSIRCPAQSYGPECEWRCGLCRGDQTKCNNHTQFCTDECLDQWFGVSCNMSELEYSSELNATDNNTDCLFGTYGPKCERRCQDCKCGCYRNGTCKANCALHNSQMVHSGDDNNSMRTVLVASVLVSVAATALFVISGIAFLRRRYEKEWIGIVQKVFDDLTQPEKTDAKGVKQPPPLSLQGISGKDRRDLLYQLSDTLGYDETSEQFIHTDRFRSLRANAANLALQNEISNGTFADSRLAPASIGQVTASKHVKNDRRGMRKAEDPDGKLEQHRNTAALQSPKKISMVLDTVLGNNLPECRDQDADKVDEQEKIINLSDHADRLADAMARFIEEKRKSASKVEDEIKESLNTYRNYTRNPALDIAPTSVTAEKRKWTAHFNRQSDLAHPAEQPAKRLRGADSQSTRLDREHAMEQTSDPIAASRDVRLGEMGKSQQTHKTQAKTKTEKNDATTIKQQKKDRAHFAGTVQAKTDMTSLDRSRTADGESGKEEKQRASNRMPETPPSPQNSLPYARYLEEAASKLRSLQNDQRGLRNMPQLPFPQMPRHAVYTQQDSSSAFSSQAESSPTKRVQKLTPIPKIIQSGRLEYGSPAKQSHYPRQYLRWPAQLANTSSVLGNTLAPQSDTSRKTDTLTHDLDASEVSVGTVYFDSESVVSNDSVSGATSISYLHSHQHKTDKTGILRKKHSKHVPPPGRGSRGYTVHFSTTNDTLELSDSGVLSENATSSGTTATSTSSETSVDAHASAVDSSSTSDADSRTSPSTVIKVPVSRKLDAKTDKK